MPLVIAGVHGTRWALVGRRPHDPPVQADLVWGDRAWLQIVDQHQCEVMSFDHERPRSVPENLDLAGGARLDPEAGALGARVAEQWPEDELHRLVDLLCVHRCPRCGGSASR